MCSKITKIEKRIVEVNHQIEEMYEIAYKKYPVKDHADTAAEGGKTKLLRNEINTLEIQRRFLLDRRESWLPKTLWIVLVPIIISIVTSILTPYIVSLLIKPKI